jgi:lipoate-protein ligase A
MKYLDLTLPSVAENLALDEALLLQAEAGQGDEVLRFWEWSSLAVILGAGGRLADDVDETACRADDVPIFRRSSGGGTVLLGPGCLCYTLVLSYDRDPALREIHSSFRFILSRIRDALAEERGSRIEDRGSTQDPGSSSMLDPRSSIFDPRSSGLSLAGVSDLAVGGRKCSGNSQQRKRRYLLHHGTILYAFDTQRVDRYLRMPARQPDYRRQRKHSEFLAYLPADCDGLKSKLIAAWKANSMTSAWPQDAVRQLVEAKYARPEWTRRR